MSVDAGWEALEQGDTSTARRLGEQALADGADAAAGWELVLAAAVDADPPAKDLLELTAQAAPHLGEDDPGLAHARGVGLFHAARFDEALPALERAAGDDPSGDATHYLGACLERLGRLAEADAALTRAAKLASGDDAPGPVRLADHDVEAVLAEALAELPPPIAQAVRESCQVVIDDFPSPRLMADGYDPFLLGLCEGTIELQRQGEQGPVRVVVYRRNLEKAVTSRAELIDELRITLFHELGHALGYDEHGVDELGLA